MRWMQLSAVGPVKIGDPEKQARYTVNFLLWNDWKFQLVKSYVSNILDL